MKNILIQTGLAGLVIIFLMLSINQCSNKRDAKKQAEANYTSLIKAEADYLALVKAKTRIDTLYKEGKTVTKWHTQFKAIRDTFYIVEGKHYQVYKDSLINEDLTLRAEITANDLKAINYNYSVREKIIREQTILTEHDTLIQQVRKGQLIALLDAGLHSYSAGVQWQSRKRLGVTARFNLYQSDKYATFGLTYRIY